MESEQPEFILPQTTGMIVTEFEFSNIFMRVYAKILNKRSTPEFDVWRKVTQLPNNSLHVSLLNFL